MTTNAVSTNTRRQGETGAATAAHATLRTLIAAKRSFLVPMTVIFLVGYIGLTALAGFAKGFMAHKVIGAVNVGFILIAANYLLAWVLAIIYVRVANAIFDPLAKKALAAMNETEGSR
jgi:uncharacterized membrane protein (DUF485 family)